MLFSDESLRIIGLWRKVRIVLRNEGKLYGRIPIGILADLRLISNARSWSRKGSALILESVVGINHA